MKSARIHAYQEPLKLEDIPTPGMPHGEEVLVKIGGTGLCHSDLHIMQGDWASSIPVQLPKTLGHEVAGWVDEVGDSVPSASSAGGLVKGDLVAIFGGRGCGACFQCKSGNEQLCNYARYPGVTDDGGYSEYIVVPSYRYLVKVDKTSGLTPVDLAPLTDAGLTPYRAIKKVRHLLGPGRTIAVIGLGGLGFYGMQYAEILGQGTVVIGIDRNEKRVQDIRNAKLVDHALSIASHAPEIQEQIARITGGGVNVVIDCVGAENTTRDAFRILNKGGALVVVGMFGNEVKIPLVPGIVNEYQVQFSLWGNYNELCEVIELAKLGKISHSIQEFSLSEINKVADMLRNGEIKGRAVIVPK
ncbi:MAG: NAD(P)-dependent alcohol dehydrogenase [Thermoproteota archaeon]|nr:NAD(P)-dependent alcohol dehydrogenase [Thermoproteota archaeon]